MAPLHAYGFEDEHDDHGGLHRDIPALVGRRDMLKMMGGLSLAGLLAACNVGTTSTTTAAPAGSSSTAIGGTTSTAAATATTAATTSSILATTPVDEIPNETVTGTALPGAVVYLWHCTTDGRYSIHQIEAENYLRGVQVADGEGRLTFISIFPGCYAGRWPHAHFEVYGSIEDATAGSPAIKTSQLAIPQADCEMVYTDGRYGTSTQSLSRLSLETDGIFADGWTDQLAVMPGSVADGYTASLLVRV